MAHAHLLSTWFNANGKRGSSHLLSPVPPSPGTPQKTKPQLSFSKKKKLKASKGFQFVSLRPENHIFCFKVPELPLKVHASSAVGAKNRYMYNRASCRQGTHSFARARTHTDTHIRARARAHTHTHTHTFYIYTHTNTPTAWATGICVICIYFTLSISLYKYMRIWRRFLRSDSYRDSEFRVH